MLSPEIGRAGFRLALLIALLSGALLVLVPPDSAEFVISALSLLVGLLLLLLIAVLARRAPR